MKKRTRNIITIIAIIGLIFSVYLMLSPLFKDDNPVTNLNCKNYSYSNCPSSCVICPPCKECSSLSCNSKEFCESIGFNSTWSEDLNPKKTYCTLEQKKAEVCTMEYFPVCGWFNQSIKCLKYPCATTYGNVCTACSSLNVEYYTSGECPK